MDNILVNEVVNDFNDYIDPGIYYMNIQEYTKNYPIHSDGSYASNGILFVYTGPGYALNNKYTIHHIYFEYNSAVFFSRFSYGANPGESISFEKWSELNSQAVTATRRRFALAIYDEYHRRYTNTLTINNNDKNVSGVALRDVYYTKNNEIRLSLNAKTGKVVLSLIDMNKNTTVISKELANFSSYLN